MGTDESYLKGFYHVYSKNMRDLGSPAHSIQWFQNIVKHYGSNVIISNVYNDNDNEVIGAGIVLFNGTSCSIPWASTNSEFNRLAPNMLLYWSLLAYATDRGANSFDFGRSTPNEGTYKFKAQWGAMPKGLDWHEYDGGELLEKDEQTGHSNLRKYVEKTWRKLPVNVATYLGSSMRKYISL